MVSWPAGIAARGEVSEQYAHAVDMIPTVLEALGIEPPEAIRGVAPVPAQPLPGKPFTLMSNPPRPPRPPR